MNLADEICTLIYTRNISKKLYATYQKPKAYFKISLNSLILNSLNSLYWGKAEMSLVFFTGKRQIRASANV